MQRTPAVLALLAALAVGASVAASCDADRSCSGNSDCDGSGSECRPSVDACPGFSQVVTLGSGQCRDKGAQCTQNSDCVPEEICDISQQPGLCGPPPAGYCSAVPSCPAGCPWTSPFPCKCVCKACPPVDGGA